VKAPARRLRISLAFLRAMITAHLLAVAAQPVLAGMFFTGDVDAITLHRLVGESLVYLGVLILGAAAAYAFWGRGQRWVLPAAVLLVVADLTQLLIGYAVQLQAHIPLGVAIVTGSALLAVWVWSPAAARPRVAR
jgi:hypothetical protein